MPNVMAPFGFREFRRMDGSAPTAGFDTLAIASSDANLYFTGDPVATSTTNGNYITIAATGTTQIRGIFKGCEYYSPTVARVVWSPFFPGTVQTTSGTGDARAWVITDPDMLFIVQASSQYGTTIGSSLIGNGFGYLASVSSQGNQTTGISVVTLSTGFGTNSSYPFRLWDLWSNWVAPQTGNFNQALPGTGAVINGTDNSTGAFGNIVIVAPNNWDRKNLTNPA